MRTLWIALLSVFIISQIRAEGLRYEGSSTIGRFIEEARRAYPGSISSIKTKSESSGGERCTVMGRCDIGGVARRVKPGYLKMGVVATLIGYDAIAVLVHRENPVSSLSSRQLRDIFRGTIRNWKEVGGIDAPITVYITNKRSATHSVFAKKIMQGYRYSAVVVEPDADILKKVAADLGGIGQLSMSFLQGDRRIKRLSIDGEPPTVDNIHYPITRPLYLVTRGEAAERATPFIEWTLSPAGQRILKHYFVGVR